MSADKTDIVPAQAVTADDVSDRVAKEERRRRRRERKAQKAALAAALERGESDHFEGFQVYVCLLVRMFMR